MPVRGVFQLKGLEEYLENIQQAGQDVDVVAADAVQAAGDIFHDAVKANAEPHRKTGEMENAIYETEPARNGNYTFVEVGVDKNDTVDHELYVEYGTAKAAPHPFFRPAIDSTRNKARAAMRAVFKAVGLAE